MEHIKHNLTAKNQTFLVYMYTKWPCCITRITALSHVFRYFSDVIRKNPSSDVKIKTYVFFFNFLDNWPMNLNVLSSKNNEGRSPRSDTLRYNLSAKLLGLSILTLLSSWNWSPGLEKHSRVSVNFYAIMIWYHILKNSMHFPPFHWSRASHNNCL